MFVQLVYADSVAEVVDRFVVLFASEDNSYIQGHEDVIVGWSGSHGELVRDVLLGDQELDLGPGCGEHDSSLLHHAVVLSVLGDDSVGSLGPIDKSIQH